jgi:transposase
VGCWAHARRKVYDVHAATASPRAQELLESIGRLFAIEAEIKGRSPEERLAARQEKSAPLLTALKVRFEETQGRNSGEAL